MLKYLFFGFILCSLLSIIVDAAARNIVAKIRIKKNNDKIKRIRDAAYDEVLEKCKEATQKGEIVYLSAEDIQIIIEDMKKK